MSTLQPGDLSLLKGCCVPVVHASHMAAAGFWISGATWFLTLDYWALAAFCVYAGVRYWK